MTDIFFVNNYVNKWREEGGKIPRELVNQLRQRMLNYVADHDDKFDQRDILQLANGDDWTVERYILEHGDSKKENLGDEPFHRLKSCLLWRKIIGINDLNKSTFPRQFFRSGLIRLYGSDLNGGRVLLIRANIYQPVPEAWDELFFKYLAFWAEKADLANTLGHGVTVLIDTDKMDYDRSFRMNLLVFFRNLIHEWYPKLVSVIVLHKLPGKFSHRDIHLRVKQCFKDVHNMQVIVSKQNYQLTLFSAEDQLPDFFGGTNEYNYEWIPFTASKANDVVEKFDIGKKEKEMAVQALEQWLQEVLASSI